MSHANIITWTCDRCGRTANMPNEDVPAGWLEVRTKVVLGNLGGPIEPGKWELCNGCANQHGRFMLGNKADSES